jgi:FG-GAP-like repeat
MKNNFNSDGKANLLVTSPWGLGVLTLAQSTIAVDSMSPNGSRFGGWLLNTKDNNTELKADFDGDGRAELLMSSPWGIGILKLINGSFTSIAMAQNGTRHGGWIINTADNQFLHAADFDRDGKEEVLVTSPWGISILKYANNNITPLMMEANGARFGGWLLNTGDNFFTLIGDFDGDKQTEIVVTSPWGLGILKFNGTTLTSIFMEPNATNLGGWVLDTSTDKFEVVGDFDGDGRDEILVSNSSKVGVLKLQGNSLTCLCIANTGDNLGSWELDSKTNKMNTVGDFDGDGKTEILVTSDWGLGVLQLNGNALQSTVAVANGTRFGGWLLNTRDNRLNYAADFDADGKVEIQITSPWGMGVLKQSGNMFNAVTMAPNGTRFGGWLLNTADNDLEAGLGQSYGLIIYHSQWQGAVDSTAAFLRSRGYTTFVTPNAATGITILKNLALYLKAGDRLFVYLAGHGGSSRALGDTTKNTSLTHILQFEDLAIVGYDQFAPSFQLLGNKGVDLSVFDGSCDGGEAVLNAIGERYLAMSTTTVYAPGITNTPNPAEIMQLFGKPSRFGLWWSPYYAASLLTSKTPHRFYQKIYRNDNTEINVQSLFYKPAIGFYTALGSGWDLMVRHCYLYRYIYPTDFNNLSQADKDAMTGTTSDFLASMRADFNALSPSIVNLKNLLNSSTWVDRAADIYTGSFPKPWQTIFGDMSWDVTTEPARHSSMNNALVPGSYKDKAGFVRMVNEVLSLITLLEQCYNRSENLRLFRLKYA